VETGIPRSIEVKVMRLLSWTFGSRWFWATLLIAASVGCVELDRRGLAPWNRPEVDESLVAAPSVDLGDFGDAAPFEGLDEFPADFAADVDLGAETDGGPASRTGDSTRPSEPGLVDVDDRSPREHTGSGFDFDAFDRDTFDREPTPPETTRRLRDPFSNAPNAGETERRDGGVPSADDLAGAPAGLGFDDGERDDDGFGTRERFELRGQLDRLGSIDDRNEFDPVISPPGAVVGVEDDLDTRPLDPANAYELKLERIDDGSHETRVAKPAADEAATTTIEILEVELDVTAPLRMTAGGTAKFEVVVRNPGDTPLRDVVLVAQFDEGFALPGRSARAARKRFGDLSGGETRKVGLVVESRAGAPAGRTCVHFAVDAEGIDSVQKRICIDVREPVVRLDVNGPQRRRAGERGEFTVTLVNDSPRELEEVRLTLDHPESMIPRAGSRGVERRTGQLVWPLGRVAAGEEIEVQASFACTTPGQACLTVALEAREAPSEPRRFCVVVE
jgi:hypothetical protein